MTPIDPTPIATLLQRAIEEARLTMPPWSARDSAAILATPSGKKVTRIVAAARALSDFMENEYITYCDETPVGPNPIAVSIEHDLRLTDLGDELREALDDAR